MIDKSKVKRSFNDHAATYDQSAYLQRRTAEELTDWIASQKLSPAAILDVGTGTGYVSLGLRRLFPRASIQACDLAHGMLIVARNKRIGSARFSNADAEFLPYRNGVFDLVVSNLSYQWLDNWSSAFKESARVLRGGGVFCFTTLGSDTLCELRDAYRRAFTAGGHATSERLHHFIGRAELKEMLESADFTDVSVQGRIEREYHTDVKHLLIGLKAIGAQNGTAGSLSGLGRPKAFRQMIALYEHLYRDAEGIPATYELLFGFGRKAGGQRP